MIVLTTSTTAQIFRFQPREGVVDSVVLVDSENRSSTTISPFTITQMEWYSEFLASFTLIENKEYQIYLYSSGSLVYQSKVLCTNQAPENYKLTNGLFTPHSSDNEFITL